MRLRLLTMPIMKDLLMLNWPTVICLQQIGYNLYDKPTNRLEIGFSVNKTPKNWQDQSKVKSTVSKKKTYCYVIYLQKDHSTHRAEDYEERSRVSVAYDFSGYSSVDRTTYDLWFANYKNRKIRSLEMFFIVWIVRSSMVRNRVCYIIFFRENCHFKWYNIWTTLDHSKRPGASLKGGTKGTVTPT